MSIGSIICFILDERLLLHSRRNTISIVVHCRLEFALVNVKARCRSFHSIELGYSKLCVQMTMVQTASLYMFSGSIPWR